MGEKDKRWNSLNGCDVMRINGILKNVKMCEKLKKISVNY